MKASRPGFTLIELILVAMILSVLVGISTPMFRRTYYDIQLEEASYSIAKFMNYARAKAVAERVNTRLNFDFEINKYWLTAAADPERPDYYGSIKGRLGRFYDVPRGIEAEAEKDSVIFYPDGRSQDFRLILKNRNNRSMAIEVKKETGQADVLEIKK